MECAAGVHLPLEQGVLLELQTPVGLGDLGAGLERTHLARGAWIDVSRQWVQGGDSVFAHLSESVEWQSERRQMFDRVVDVPRLVAFYNDYSDVPHPAMVEAARLLGSHYSRQIPAGFTSAGLCLYRGGKDSVAWHGDNTGRSATNDTVIAVISLGAPRTFALRPRGGGSSIRFTLDSGDLLVMGGSCQRTWEHAVPKTARPVAPRISVQFRPYDVN